MKQENGELYVGSMVPSEGLLADSIYVRLISDRISHLETITSLHLSRPYYEIVSQKLKDHHRITHDLHR
jgi:hypothetical protein